MSMKATESIQEMLVIFDYAHTKITEVNCSFPEFVLACIKQSFHLFNLEIQAVLKSCGQDDGHTHF